MLHKNEAQRYSIVSVGNAIVDLILNVDEHFLQKHNLIKGTMQLIDKKTAHSFQNATKSYRISAGGSAANTAIWLSHYLNNTAYIGTVSEDAYGLAYRKEFEQKQIHFLAKLEHNGLSTGCCFVFVTPDGQRTMCTYLGASQELSLESISLEALQTTRFGYFEGYLWDSTLARSLCYKLINTIIEARGHISFSLSDQFCVARHRADFLNLLCRNLISSLFCNHHEFLELMQTDSIDYACQQAQELMSSHERPEVIFVTQEKDPVLIVTKESVERLNPQPVPAIVDSTGAGDSFSAGALLGLIHKKSYITCARIGTIFAALAIQHLGARPNTSAMQSVSSLLNEPAESP